MRLSDLDPRWIQPGVLFAFRCPHCKTEWLTCKNVPMDRLDQIHAMTAAGFGGDWVPTRPEFGWAIEGDDFATMTIKPSIDASASGHWHGHVTNGAIV